MYIDNIKEHLPLFGVGPIIVYGQLVFTAISIILTIFFDVKIRIEWLKIPFIIIGIRYHGLPEGEDASFFLCKELIPGYLDGVTGEYATPAGYFVDEAKAE